MNKLPIKILTISWDSNLAMNNPIFGDVQERNIAYGKYVSAIHSITYTKKTENLTNRTLSDNVFVYSTQSKNPLAFLLDSYCLAKKICLTNKIDLVLTQDPFLTGLVGWWLKKKFNLKLLIHFHGDFWRNHEWLKEKWYNFFLLFLSYFLVKKADAVRAVSLGIKNKLIKQGINAQKIIVIPTPINLNLFLSVDEKKINLIREKYRFLTSDKIILFVGRLEPEKNLIWFIDVFNETIKKKPETKFLIIGTGREKNKIIKKINSLNLVGKIILIGNINHNLLPVYYHLANLLILPSTSESFGKVLVEAGAAGIPCVASATTGAKEIIKDNETGFLAPINNDEKMKAKILLILADENLQKKFKHYL